MKITLKNFQVSNILDTLGEISGQDITDIRVSYRVGKLIKALTPHEQDYQESRKKLITKYAKKDEDGELLPAVDSEGNEIPDAVQLEDQKAFNEEIVKILQDELEVDLPVLITVDDLAEAGVKLSPAKTLTLEPIFEGGEK